MLGKWKKADLEYMRDIGYSIVPCTGEDDALKVKQVLKRNSRCAQAGYILNKNNVQVFFCLTKLRSQKGGTNNEGNIAQS